ncbi:hypothetical protein HDF10_001238 [Edaphobacter lichenicola]|uniref:Uncharacterized protein n=1 Tax=Tunturiibacter lichenicola TaxID=2051959 RepID=A0A7W8J661_9BACT|nr:hypothetical protein [Edaphobacter lichenicola]
MVEETSSSAEGEIVDDTRIAGVANVEVTPGIGAAKASDIFRSIRLSCADRAVIERVREHVVAGYEKSVMKAMRQIGLKSVKDRHTFVRFCIDLAWEE